MPYALAKHAAPIFLMFFANVAAIVAGRST